MRKLIIGLVALTLFACKGKSDKTDTTKKDTTLTSPGNTNNTTNQDSTTKQTTLVFTGYEEGDYAHLVFKDLSTNEDYDFGHPTENVLGTEDVVKENKNSSFGYEENKARVGQKYQATLEWKLVDYYDDNGQPRKDNRWRITSLRKI